MPSFPTTPILDGGISPVEDPISTNGWIGPIISGNQQLKRTSTGIARGSAAGSGSYLNTTYGPDVEIYTTIATLEAATNVEEVLFARGVGFGTASISGYSVKASRRSTASTDRIRLYREDSNVSTQIGTSYVLGTIVDGDKFGLQVLGSSLTAWYCPLSTGIWVPAITATDASYPSAGPIGVLLTRSTTRFTDLGGGTSAAASTGGSRRLLTLGVA